MIKMIIQRREMEEIEKLSSEPSRKWQSPRGGKFCRENKTFFWRAEKVDKATPLWAELDQHRSAAEIARQKNKRVEKVVVTMLMDCTTNTR
jgi:hypothetical protein